MMEMRIVHKTLDGARLIREGEIRALEDTIAIAHEYAIYRIHVQGMTDTGHLERSITPDFTKVKEGIGRLWTNAPHAMPNEFGAGPSGEDPAPKYWPPRKPILRWCQRKLGLSGKEAERASWAIVHHIHEIGLQPRPYMRPAADKARQALPRKLTEYLGILGKGRKYEKVYEIGG